MGRFRFARTIRGGTADRPSERHDVARIELYRQALCEVERWSIGRDTLVVHDARPECEEGPPIVFVPGYFAEGDSFRENMLDILLLGRRVLTYDAYHGIDDTGMWRRYGHRICDLQERDPDSDIRPQLRKAAALLTLVERKRAGPVDLFAHSEGAIVATIAAYLRPDLFGRIALLSPVGLHGKFLTWMDFCRCKMLDDCEVLRERLAAYEGRVLWSLCERIKRLAPRLAAKLSSDRCPSCLRWRQVSSRYKDATEEALSARRHHLYRELESIARRKLEHWLPLLDISQVSIGAGSNDRICPVHLVHKHSRSLGIRDFYILQNASHNPHHYKPECVTEFIRHALHVSTRHKRTWRRVVSSGLSSLLSPSRWALPAWR